MFKTGYLSVSAGVASLGATLLLLAFPGERTATNQPFTVPEVRPAAVTNFGDIYPWLIGLGGGNGSAGNVSWNVLNASGAGGNAVGADGALQTANLLGPFAFNLDSVRSFSASQAAPGATPPGGQPINLAVADFDRWMVGAAGLASSTGLLGWEANSAFGNTGGFANYAGTLQTANQVGPAVFNLNVLKAISFSQATNGTTLTGRQPDNFSAVDIGRWQAGIPGLIYNTGTTGFVNTADFGGAASCQCQGDPGPTTTGWVGGLHTTTQIGPMVFDFNFLPAISASNPGGFSFSTAPDLTTANTPFANYTPPMGAPFPFAASAPAPAAASIASDPPTAGPVGDAPDTQTSRTVSTASTPKPVIPGVNGAPLAPRTPKPGTSTGTTDPFSPFTDMFQQGFAAFTGTTTGTPSTGTPSTTGNNPPSGGANTGSGGSTGGTG
ncbi:hypothetical protein Mycsm_04740 [Mycobacterium sp. JS623]|uniref:hypothetical protein n=1 Tax=Mycobacterium sp. JS623 TaxID=212767 RepID=UPI0002A568D6|nr:hypothetical protein [Mycobacterium sp. JS623]AGB24964.1 hypothetical protein Mycsm_04740 [Mycobacterium sp. JS623]